MNSQSLNMPQTEANNFQIYDISAEPEQSQKPKSLIRKDSYSQPPFNYDDENQCYDYKMIKDKDITCIFENEIFKIIIPKLEFEDMATKLLNEKQYVDFSNPNLKLQIQKQLINLAIKILYKTSQDQNLIEDLNKEAQSIIESWFTLIETNKKIQAGNRQCRRLEELNQHQIFKEWLKNKNQQKKKMNEGQYGFNIKFFNKQLKNIKCGIKIQKISQCQELKNQIKDIENYLCENQLGGQEQEFMLLQISAFKEYILQILREKFQMYYYDQMEDQQVVQIENLNQEEIQIMKRNFNFNTQNLIHLMKESSIEAEYSELKSKLITDQQFEKEIKKILNIEESAPAPDKNRVQASPLNTILEMIDKKLEKIKKKEVFKKPKQDGRQRKKVKI